MIVKKREAYSLSFLRKTQNEPPVYALKVEIHTISGEIGNARQVVRLGADSASKTPRNQGTASGRYVYLNELFFAFFGGRIVGGSKPDYAFYGHGKGNALSRRIQSDLFIQGVQNAVFEFFRY